MVVAVTMLPFRPKTSGDGIPMVLELGSRAAAIAASSPFAEPSKLWRGVPVEISVETDWFKEKSVSLAAECRDVMMAGPGKIWALVI